MFVALIGENNRTLTLTLSLILSLTLNLTLNIIPSLSYHVRFFLNTRSFITNLIPYMFLITAIRYWKKIE